MTDTAFAPKLKRLGSETLIYGLTTIVGKFLGYLLQPYYAHQFDPAQNGIQSVVYSYIPIIGIALYLGMDIAYMRYASGEERAGEHEHQRAFTMCVTNIAVIGGVIAMLALGAAPALARFVRLDRASFMYMVAISFTDALLAVPFAYLRMEGKPIRYGGFKLLFIAISISLNIVLIGRMHWGVSAIFFANLVANLVVLLFFSGDFLRQFRPSLLAGAAWAPLWSYALPVLPATLAVMLIENGDRITLNYLSDVSARAAYGMSAKDVIGIYSFNYKAGVAMLLVVQMFRLAWTPFALQHAREPRAPELYSRVLTALMLVCSLVFLGVAMFLPAFAAIPVVYRYVKPEYWQGLPIVPVILLGYVFSGMYAVVTAGLYIERKTHVLAWIATAGAVLNLAICIVAAPRWGMVSVAWATPAAYALMALLGAWQSNRVFPVPFEWTRLAALGGVCAALFAVDRWLAAQGVPPLSVTGVAGKSGLLIALPALLLAGGFFRHGEMRVLRSIVSRG